MRWFGVLAAVMVGALVCSCRFIPTADVQALAAGQSQAKAPSIPTKWFPQIGPLKLFPISKRELGHLLRCATSPRSLQRKQAHGSAIGQSLGTNLGRFW